MTQAPNVHDAEPIPDAARAEVERLLLSGDLFRYTAPRDAPVTLLERDFAAMMGSAYALAVSSCSAALFLSLKALGLPIIDHGSHIVPVIVGDPKHTKMISDMLLEHYGVYVQPINYPTVPRGTERLRFTPSPVHGPKMIDGLVKAMDGLWAHCALNRQELSA